MRCSRKVGPEMSGMKRQAGVSADVENLVFGEMLKPEIHIPACPLHAGVVDRHRFQHKFPNPHCRVLQMRREPNLPLNLHEARIHAVIGIADEHGQI